MKKPLHKLEVKIFVVSGFAVEHCVLLTYNGAKERNFKVAMQQHCIASFDSQAVKKTHNNQYVISFGALDFILDKV